MCFVYVLYIFLKIFFSKPLNDHVQTTEAWNSWENHKTTTMSRKIDKSIIFLDKCNTKRKHVLNIAHVFLLASTQSKIDRFWFTKHQNEFWNGDE